MLFTAFAGMAFKLEYDITLSTGESYEAKDPYGHTWKFVSQGVSTSSRIDRETQAVGLEAFRDGKRVGIISARSASYLDSQGNQLFQPITEVGIHSPPSRTRTSCSPACVMRDTRRFA